MTARRFYSTAAATLCLLIFTGLPRISDAQCDYETLQPMCPTISYLTNVFPSFSINNPTVAQGSSPNSSCSTLNTTLYCQAAYCDQGVLAYLQGVENVVGYICNTTGLPIYQQYQGCLGSGSLFQKTRPSCFVDVDPDNNPTVVDCSSYNLAYNCLAQAATSSCSNNANAGIFMQNLFVLWYGPTLTANFPGCSIGSITPLNQMNNTYACNYGPLTQTCPALSQIFDGFLPMFSIDYTTTTSSCAQYASIQQCISTDAGCSVTGTPLFLQGKMTAINYICTGGGMPAYLTYQADLGGVDFQTELLDCYTPDANNNPAIADCNSYNNIMSCVAAAAYDSTNDPNSQAFVTTLFNDWIQPTLNAQFPGCTLYVYSGSSRLLFSAPTLFLQAAFVLILTIFKSIH